MKYRLVFAIVMLASVWPSRAVAAEARPRQVALGLSILDPGISLWHVEGKMMVGLELNRLQWSWQDEKSYHFRGALTVKRILSQGPGPLFQFGHLSAYHKTRLEYESDHPVSRGPGIAIGGGVMFQPWEKTRLMIRQGIAVERAEDEHLYPSSGYDTLGWVEETWKLWLRARLLLLVYF